MKAYRTNIRSEIVATDKQTGEEIDRKADVKHKALPMKNEAKIGSDGTPERAKNIAVIKVSNGVTLCFGYQSVRMDIGIEMPWEVEPGQYESAVAGFEQGYSVIDEELSNKLPELDEFLRSIAKKYAR